jgi:hypothetical protein
MSHPCHKILLMTYNRYTMLHVYDCEKDIINSKP